MTLNKLQHDFKDAIEELTLIAGRNGATLSCFSHYTANLNPDLFKDNNLLVQSGLPFDDVTDAVLPNVRMTCEQYKLTTDNANQEIQFIMNHARLLYIAQAYEVLESFLYNQVAQLLVEESNIRSKFANLSGKTEFGAIRKAIHLLEGERKYNQHLTKLLRDNCSLFAQYENENIYSKEFRQWFKLIGVVRNCITHNRGEVTNYVKQELPACYTDRFEIRQISMKYMLYINFGHCSQLLGDIAKFMFFIHKAVSKRCYDVDIDLLSTKLIFPDRRFIRHVGDKIEFV